MSEIASRVKAIIVDKLGVEESEGDIGGGLCHVKRNVCQLF